MVSVTDFRPRLLECRKRDLKSAIDVFGETLVSALDFLPRSENVAILSKVSSDVSKAEKRLSLGAGFQFTVPNLVSILGESRSNLLGTVLA
jgi:hypothetical protein